MNRNYAKEGGDKYGFIVEVMTNIGYPMRHSTVRNTLVRGLGKFVNAYADYYDIRISEEDVRRIVDNPQFQSAVRDMLHSVDT